ncbi:hypothetical protein UFOVP345_55 [uncultured Caudovirales phage]|uniref:Uncharacterized protein n=1 Tax=uncultured Caudovirales phage TaxID=2100421 RepID=A0A6J5LYA7_9CAUD|nr:hypothetical protein UFOVP345_55 [uncultured Caudovirales phage]
MRRIPLIYEGFGASARYQDFLVPGPVVEQPTRTKIYYGPPDLLAGTTATTAYRMKTESYV